MKHLHECRFPDTILSNDTHFVEAREDVFKIVEYHFVAISLAHFMSLEDFVADIARLHIQLHVLFASHIGGFLFQLVECVDSVFCFPGTRLWLATHPVEFLAEQVVRLGYFRLLLLESFGAFLKIVVVIAFVGINAIDVDFHYLVAHIVEEISVVCNHQECDSASRQVIFEPLNGGDVEMVGRLVEKQQIGVADEHSRYCHSLLLSARQFSHWLIHVVNAELRKNLLETVFVVPGVGCVHLPDVIGYVCSRHRGALILLENGRYLVIVVEASVDNAAFGIEHRHLFEVAYPQIVAECDFAAVVLFVPCEHAHEGGFAGAVFGYDADFLPLRHPEREIGKEDSVSK